MSDSGKRPFAPQRGEVHEEVQEPNSDKPKTKDLTTERTESTEKPISLLQK